MAFNLTLNILSNKLLSFASFNLTLLYNIKKLQFWEVSYSFEKLLFNIIYLLLYNFYTK